MGGTQMALRVKTSGNQATYLLTALAHSLQRHLHLVNNMTVGADGNQANENLAKRRKLRL